MASKMHGNYLDTSSKLRKLHFPLKPRGYLSSNVEGLNTPVWFPLHEADLNEFDDQITAKTPFMEEQLKFAKSRGKGKETVKLVKPSWQNANSYGYDVKISQGEKTISNQTRIFLPKKVVNHDDTAPKWLVDAKKTEIFKKFNTAGTVPNSEFVVSGLLAAEHRTKEPEAPKGIFSRILDFVGA